MNRINRLLLVAAAFVFCINFGASVRAEDENTTDLIGKPAPDFFLQTLENKPVRLSQLKGHVVVVDFWATWCPPCRKSLPHLQAVSTNKEFAEKGLLVLGVNAQETKDKAQGFMKQNQYTFTVPLDSKGDVLKSYLVQGIPTTIVVGRDGKIKNAFIGFGGEASEKQLDKAITDALNEPTPKQAA